MKKHIKLARGSGNVFRDLNHKDADVLQAKSLAACAIIEFLSQRGLTDQEAQALTNIPAEHFLCIRNAQLERFTPELLEGILARLSKAKR